MTSKDLPALNVGELRKLPGYPRSFPRNVLEALQARIAEVDPQIDAYLSLDFDDALKQAERADLDLPLGGVPIAIKDIISVAGQPCTCASKILRNYRATYDATVVRKLKAAGAIPFGKTNMDEFAMGSSTENSSVKPTRNPWDLSRVPGGSSGGSAAAVAADAAFAALGTDTGGSVRQPAALSGVVGLKPSYGRVSRFGLVAFASSLDQAGPLTKTVRDAALLMNAIAGPDPQDSTCLNEPAPDYTANLEGELRGVRLGLPKEYLIDGIDAQVRAAIDAAVAQFSSLGAEIVEVSLPHTEYAVATYYMIASAEASANLARFDGVRYGHRAENPRDLLDLYGRTREEGFGPEVKRRIILGHLRSQRRLLRRLLRSRAKGARADPARFRAGVREGGRVDLADFAGCRFPAGRKIFRSVANVSGGCFHDRGEPRRDLRDQSAMRFREDGGRNGAADWVASAREAAG